MDEVALLDLRITPPLGYLDFLNLMANARLVLTDSARRRRRSWHLSCAAGAG